ncbi:MAG: thermonuclease family protein [bacterium]|nr:thermonuclease family protein [bacterium]
MKILREVSLTLIITVIAGYSIAQLDVIKSSIKTAQAVVDKTKEVVTVESVISGDTIKLADGRIIRYIGIDAPDKEQCMYRTAAKINQVLVEGKQVVIEKDHTELDPDGNVLRYVWIADQLINERIVSEGYARNTPQPPNLKYNGRFLNAHNQARELNKGLWAVCN